MRNVLLAGRVCFFLFILTFARKIQALLVHSQILQYQLQSWHVYSQVLHV